MVLLNPGQQVVSIPSSSILSSSSASSHETGLSAQYGRKATHFYERFMLIIKEVEEFINRSCDIADIKRRLVTLPHHLKQKQEFRSLQKDRMALQPLTSANALMIYLAPYWDELHPDILFHLIDSLGTDSPPTLISEYRSYKTDLAQFMKGTTPLDHRVFSCKEVQGFLQAEEVLSITINEKQVFEVGRYRI